MLLARLGYFVAVVGVVLIVIAVIVMVLDSNDNGNLDSAVLMPLLVKGPQALRSRLRLS